MDVRPQLDAIKSASETPGLRLVLLIHLRICAGEIPPMVLLFKSVLHRLGILNVDFGNPLFAPLRILKIANFKSK